MKKVLKLIFYFNIFFLFFDVKDMNTIDDIALIYDSDSLYDEKYYNVSFYSLYLSDIEKEFKDLDIEILSITPENYDKIEFNGVDKVLEKIKDDFYKNGEFEKAINLYASNFKIKSMTLLSTKENMLKLENRVKII